MAVPDITQQAGVDRVKAGLDNLQALGAIDSWTHEVEPRRGAVNPAATVDLFTIHLTADGRPMIVPFSAARAFVRGFYLGQHHPKAAPSPRSGFGQ